MAKDKPSVEHTFGDARDRIVDRAKARGVRYELAEWNEPTPDDRYALILHFKNGDQERVRTLDGEDAALMEGVNFEDIEVIGREYRSIYDTSTGELELLIDPVPREAARFTDFMQVPGVEIFPTNGGIALERGIENDRVKIRHTKGTSGPVLTVDDVAISSGDSNFSWRLPVANCSAPIHVELSPASDRFRAFLGRWEISDTPLASLTLKIRGLEYANYEDFLVKVETLAGGLFYEFDLRFDIGLALARRVQDEKRVIRVGDEQSGSHPLTFPNLSYPRAATTLYAQGRSLSNTSVSRYLAYYQSIEYFFPAFIGRDAIDKMRRVIADARFDVRSDDHLQRLIRYATRGTVKGSGEREQLLATIQQSLDDAELAEFITALPLEARKFLSERDSLTGVPTVNLKHNTRLTQQIRDRVYAIRNRIAHAKDAGAEEFAEPLLPLSTESRLLSVDLRLIEHVAQRVIAAGSLL